MLNEALAVINSRKTASNVMAPYYLVTGFEPLHLKTFFSAALLQRLPGVGIKVCGGVYGDLFGSVALAAKSAAHGAAVVLEWIDIDPRLGLRGSGGWSEDLKPDILATAQERCSRLEAAIRNLATRMPVAVAGPNLALPPIGHTIGAQSSAAELALEHMVATMILQLAPVPGVRILNESRLDAFPACKRLDPKMELIAGFPYALPFAEQLATSLAELLQPSQPKKGLITDLDDTLWSGIVGEVGTAGISWSLENHSQVHGLYQQMLAQLASCGVLLAACSKNELPIVEAALAREDLLLRAKSIFPVYANWNRKSQSIKEILSTWSIGQDDVVFIDDSPMELEEAKSAFPGLTCLQFTPRDPDGVWKLLCKLRDLFGKPMLMEEDRLRQASIRASAVVRETGEPCTPDFLRTLNGTVIFDWRSDPNDKRPLELINKTNQFNLNGARVTEGEWREYLEDPDRLQAVISYSDRFGSLGKVAVLLGKKSNGTLQISHWVMSCRAFSRRLEHHVLHEIFVHSGVEQLDFAYSVTEKNQVLQSFFREIGVGPEENGSVSLSKSAFLARNEILPHQRRDVA